jgi:hypothetical protein
MGSTEANRRGIRIAIDVSGRMVLDNCVYLIDTSVEALSQIVWATREQAKWKTM